MEKRNVSGYLVMIVLTAISLTANAQPGNPVNPVPLDGGLSLLAFAGIAYGYDRVKKRGYERRDDEVL